MLYSWGRGEDGQCGNGDTNDQVRSIEQPMWFNRTTVCVCNTHVPPNIQQELPTPVEALRHKTVGQIACGSGHTVILTDDGEVRRRWAMCMRGVKAGRGIAPLIRVHGFRDSSRHRTAHYLHTLAMHVRTTGVVVGPRGRRAAGPQRLQLEVRAAAGQGIAGAEHQAGG